MTYQQVLWAIDEAAELAAASAADAFGSQDLSALPSARTAWEFLHEQIYVESDRPAALPEVMPRQFKHDYERHLRLLLASGATV